MTETERVKTVRRLWKKKTVCEIAIELGISYQAVYRIAKRAKLEMQKVAQEEESPSEDEIKELAKEIRATWSETEAEKRLVGCRSGHTPWTPPVINLRG